MFEAVMAAMVEDRDMAAARLLIDRIIPTRRGATVNVSLRPLKTPETDLLDGVGQGRLTPEEAQTISAIVAKRAELFASVELASEIEALRAQLATIVGTRGVFDQSPVRDHLTDFDPVR